MDHSVVKRLRAEVGDRLREQRRLDAAAGLPPMSGEDERQFARALIAQVLEEHARSEITAGRVPPNAAGGRAARRRDPRGPVRGRAAPAAAGGRSRSRTSTSTAATGSSSATPTAARCSAEPVADTDEELIELIQVLAAYSGLSSRPFDTANPQLDLRLPDGSRLSAVMDVTLRPARVDPPRPAGQGLPRRPGRQRHADRPRSPRSSPRRSRPARTS